MSEFERQLQAFVDGFIEALRFIVGLVVLYWLAYIALVLVAGLAYAQGYSTHVKTVTVPATKADQLGRSQSFGPIWTRPHPMPESHIFWKPIQPAEPLVVKIAFGPGGMIGEHRKLYADYQNRGVMVELRGPCYSACTLLLAHVDADRICIAAGAFLGFHAAQSDTGPNPVRHQHATNLMYATYPEPVKAWIDARGGPEKLPGPRQGYWTMYDRDLWEMGYARCL